VRADAELIGWSGRHEVRSSSEDYLQPYVYLSHHLVQMRAAGWQDADFDTIAAVSGASALFGFKPDDFRPKYAHLHIGLDQRIADATGFGYEWVDFKGVGQAWALVVESVDAGRTLKGHDWESILFAGYQAAARPDDRRIYAMADGPEYYSRWLPWPAFSDWVERVGKWGCQRLGRHTELVSTRPSREVATKVMESLVAWSEAPPDSVISAYPDASFGLAGIDAFATYLDQMGPQDDWIACHPINPQWTTRNSTSVYLTRLAEDGVFGAQVSGHLSSAATQYRAAYECWEAAYAIFGHGSTEEARRLTARRAALVAIVRAWRAHETAALGAVGDALAALGGM
jgi:hypothetical protein